MGSQLSVPWCFWTETIQCDQTWKPYLAFGKLVFNLPRLFYVFWSSLFLLSSSLRLCLFLLFLALVCVLRVCAGPALWLPGLACAGPECGLSCSDCSQPEKGLGVQACLPSSLPSFLPVVVLFFCISFLKSQLTCNIMIGSGAQCMDYTFMTLWSDSPASLVLTGCPGFPLKNLGVKWTRQGIYRQILSQSKWIIREGA